MIDNTENIQITQPAEAGNDLKKKKIRSMPWNGDAVSGQASDL